MMPKHTGIAIGLFALALAVLPARGAAIEHDDDAVTASLANGVSLRFAKHGGVLLGLQQATVDGIELTSGDTVLRPVITQEWDRGQTGGPMIWPLLKLAAVESTDDGGARITADLLGTTDERALRGFFVYAADRDRALAEGMTGELRALQAKRDAAIPRLDAALEEHPDVVNAREDVAKWEAELSKPDLKPHEVARNQTRLERSQAELKQTRRGLYVEAAKGSDDLAQAHADVRAFDAALDDAAINLGKIHRDYYRFPHIRLPAEVSSVAWLREHADALAEVLEPAGKLTWTITPAEVNVGGWPWKGFTHHYRFELADGRDVNSLRQLGTWELGGKAAGTTLVAMRYRGLGEIEQPLTARDDGGVAEAFTTTEIIPGAAGGAPLISPVVPKSEKVNDRGYALQHRAAAWITRCARGGGQNFVEYQYRPAAALASWHARQGGLRAVTEAMPGDAAVSYTDEEYFALTSAGETIPQTVVALVRPEAADAAFWRTRWAEVDQHVRDAVSAELGFEQPEALPGVGLLYDHGWAGHLAGLGGDYGDGLAALGVRMLAIHNPGWINGRYAGPKDAAKTPPRTGGGVCNIYDYVPTADAEQPWQAMSANFAAHGIAYYPWLGQTTWKDAPLARRIGYDAKHWSLNGPNDDHGPGYGAENVKGNIYDPGFREGFLGALEQVRQTYGYQGFWAAESAEHQADSMQRGWWEQIAAWSQQGVAWMAESHSFPGLSCSIEVAGWEEDVWAMRHTWKWLRGTEQNHWSQAEWDAVAYRMMAAKGWLAPDCSYNRPIPDKFASFKRYAHEYLAALPDMRREYQLGDGRGVLWLPYDTGDRGVWFAFDAGRVPDGVVASPVTGGDAVGEVEARHTYRVKGDDLLAAFGVAAPPLDDPRAGKKYEPFDYVWTVTEKPQ